MTLERAQTAEHLEIPDYRLMETSRVLVLKKDKKGKFQALFCENRNRKSKPGRDQEKSAKWELPGGKLYDSGAEKGLFFDHLNEEHKDEIRARTAVTELEQETGIYISQSRLTQISTEFTPLVGEPHEDFPEASYRKTNIFVVILQEGEYEKMPQNIAAAMDNDDQHAEVLWAPDFDIEELVDSDYEDIIARNSRLSPAAAAKIETVMTETSDLVQTQVSQMANSNNTIIKDGELFPTDFFKGKIFGQDKISSVDFNGQPPLSEEDFRKSFKTQFGLELTNDSVETFVKRILLTYCKPYAAERAKFMGEPLNNQNGLTPRAYGRKLEAYIESLIHQIKTPEDFYNFYTRSNNSRLGRRLLRAFFGFGKISQLDYFAYIAGHEEDFNQSLIEGLANQELDPSDPNRKKLKPKVDSKGRYEMSVFTHGRKCFLELDSGVKTIARMASKSTTKAEVNPHDIKDVYRARVIVEDEADIPELITALRKKFGHASSGYSKSWRLEEDKDADTNINRDKERKEVKVKGRYPIPGTSGIPIEFMIMTKESYNQNESRAKHHNVYTAIQTLVEESRPTDGIPSESYIHILNQLENDPAILQSYPRYSPDNHEAIRKKLRRDLYARFSHYFFEHEGHYYAYQHVLRVRNTPNLIKNEDELFLSMTTRLNQRIGCKLTAQEWKSLLDNPYSFPAKTLLEKVGFKMPEFLEIVDQTKWATDVSEQPIFSSLIKHFGALGFAKNSILDMCEVLCYGFAESDFEQRKHIRKNKSHFQEMAELCYERRGFLNFLNSL